MCEDGKDSGNAPQDVEALAVAFRDGAREAVRVVQERVRRILRFRGYRMSDADRRDLEQDVMTQLWQAANRPEFAPGDRFWGFVEVVTARRSIDWLRQRSQRNREVPLDERLRERTTGPLGATLRRERSEIAESALAQLAKPCRDLIYLRVGRGKSYAELSGLLGKSEEALRVQMHRCIGRARRLVAPHEGAGESGAKRSGNR